MKFVVLVAISLANLLACGAGSADTQSRSYPWHTDIVSTTFWVGEIFDPLASDGSQEISTYDANWLANYGGCDGVIEEGKCRTEPRHASNGFFPTRMKPLQNPFYLDLPFDDVNDPDAHAARNTVVPWANDLFYRERAEDAGFSFMKNRWVELRKGERRCFGQIQDAGPAVYDDAAYVFGSGDPRPRNSRFNGAGLDVSPALNGCLGFSELDGQNDRVDWRFVEDDAIPHGAWTRLVTAYPGVGP